MSCLFSLNGDWTSLGSSDVCGKVESCSPEEMKLLDELAANAQSSANLYKAIAGEGVFGEWNKDIMMGFCE